ncbi:hypothetical protein GUITHDRAFT_116767 [Guillardia theta CCMP2712]|uniref:Uncharacterized protein n=2 Tax=Guillardia theta TaxID=55529 RepID=L1IMK4_GUITC|nr:hypothetical protein GUITHDRAFT_116767 [Guillardia theta CCMP2712]EKX37040.1 hypothetical protein GUITHDRAFT_116767 [Guillardia theta CCMP2712]|eukprot:XP_005824020.1 hypothetical protein GUITHDRAFT_116767 [Guillardia theta CCMP2712]
MASRRRTLMVLGALGVVCLVWAHAMAGRLVYGRTRLLQIGGGFDVAGVWWKKIAPSKGSIRKEALKMVKEMKQDEQLEKEVKGIQSAEAKARAVLHGNSGGRMMELHETSGKGMDDLGINVPSLKHFQKAAASGDYYQRKYRYGDSANKAEDTKAGDKKNSKLLEPGSYPAVGFPWAQTSIDTAYSNGPAKTFDTPPDVTCPRFIPNCNPQLNTLKSCDASCGAFCQALRADGPCLSGDSEGEWRNCKFGYRGAKSTPSSEDEESGWLEAPEKWEVGGPTDCMTCPVGFKVLPMYGDGTGKCVPCEEGWVDPETGIITEEGCRGGQYAVLKAGEEPGQKEGTEDFGMLAGCFSTSELPADGSQILAKIPDEVKETPFFEGYPGDYYPAQVMGYDADEDKLAIKFDDGGPFVPLSEGISAKVGDDFVPIPKTGDKVTISQAYWDDCCSEEYDPSISGPLMLGDVGEVTSSLPPEANEAAPYTVLAPNGVRWMYSAGEILPVIGEVKCSLPGLVHINTVGPEMNTLKEVEEPPAGMTALPEDPECCCCTRDLWVGCWGWCGDQTVAPPILSRSAPHFRAGYGAKPGEVGGPGRGEYPMQEPPM